MAQPVKVKNRDARSAARVAGGLIGGVAGNAIHQRFTKRDGEIFVRTVGKRGQLQMISVVQDDDFMAVGDNRTFSRDRPRCDGVHRKLEGMGASGSVSCNPGQCGSLRGEL